MGICRHRSTHVYKHVNGHVYGHAYKHTFGHVYKHAYKHVCRSVYGYVLDTSVYKRAYGHEFDGGEKDGLGASRLASHLSFGSFFNLAGVGSGATVT